MPRKTKPSTWQPIGLVFDAKTGDFKLPREVGSDLAAIMKSYRLRGPLIQHLIGIAGPTDHRKFATQIREAVKRLYWWLHEERRPSATQKCAALDDLITALTSAITVLKALDIDSNRALVTEAVEDKHLPISSEVLRGAQVDRNLPDMLRWAKAARAKIKKQTYASRPPSAAKPAFVEEVYEILTAGMVMRVSRNDLSQFAALAGKPVCDYYGVDSTFSQAARDFLNAPKRKPKRR